MDNWKRLKVSVEWPRRKPRNHLRKPAKQWAGRAPEEVYKGELGLAGRFC